MCFVGTFVEGFALVLVMLDLLDAALGENLHTGTWSSAVHVRMGHTAVHGISPVN